MIKNVFKISTTSLFRLVAVAAVGLAIVNWWPHSTARTRDGSISWYRGLWGQRSFFKVTGSDRFGCRFNVNLNPLPGYSLMTGTYPDGTLRENTVVYVSGSIDGCVIDRRNIADGKYYSPDGTEVGRVESGTGNIMYCQPNGCPFQEFVLENGQLVLERNWYKDGTLQSERKYLDGKLHGVCTDYHRNGQLRSSSTYRQNFVVDAVWYDQKGTAVNTFLANTR